MNDDIRRLLFDVPPHLFHAAFERYLGLPLAIRHRFKDEGLLLAIRKAYLWESCAEEARSSIRDKLFYYHDALHALNAVFIDAATHIEPAILLFICHYKAKLHYQMGYQWMMLDQAMEQDFDLMEWFVNQGPLSDSQYTFVQHLSARPLRLLQHAVACFENATGSYARFINETHTEEDDAFYTVSQDLHQTFADLDAYSPWARLVSIACNHFLCMQEQEDDTSSKALLAMLMGRIERHQAVKRPKSAGRTLSDEAIAEVDALLEAFKPVINIPKAKKAKSSLKPTESTRIPDWKPVVTNREQFNATLEKDTWITPSFLRPRQQADLRIIYQSLSRYVIPLVVTKPTGTGKTAEFSVVTNGAWSNGVSTIIVVPTATLVEQTRDKLIEYKKHSGMLYDVSHIKMFCPTKKSVGTGPITIVTQSSYVCQSAKALQRFPSRLELLAYMEANPHAHLEKEVLFHPDFFSLLIVDEGHHMEGERLFEIMTRPECNRPKILFSASTHPGEYSRIDAHCQHIITQTLREAIISQELAPLQALTVDFSMYPEAKQLTRSIRHRMQNRQDGAELDEESRREIANLFCEKAGFSLTAVSVLKQIMAQVPRTKKVMVFTDSIDHANLLSVLLSKLFDKPIGAFHTKEADRDQVLSRFSRNETSIIVAVGALDEGFDDSNVNLILDFSMYKSRVRRMLQRLGRALRLREDGSGAILVSIKLLPKDLQLIPRDAILGVQQHSYLGLPETDVLDETTLPLALPESLCLPPDSIRFFEERTIVPQGAAVIFPKNRKPHKLGLPPEDYDAVDEMPSGARKRSHQEMSQLFRPAPEPVSHAISSSSVVSTLPLQAHPDDELTDFDFDALLADMEWGLPAGSPGL